jgi:two-component system sensor histidine kinase RegB
MAPRDTAAALAASDPVGLTWLVTVRWTTMLAGVGAVIAGQSALQTSVPLAPAIALLAMAAASNLWLMWQVRSGPGPTPAAGILIGADVLLLTWLLWRSGGVLNPASVFYLVQIVVAALVLGRTWTVVVTSLCVGGYATLFLAPSEELGAAQVMHPEIELHMRGMWLAFALTAVIIGILVARLAIAIERRDLALNALRERTAQATRIASLATLAAGAAHELGTPLSTIAVAARELERSLAGGSAGALGRDAALIRSETDRCRRILEAMAAGSGEPAGETPRQATLGEVMDALRARLGAGTVQRVHIEAPSDLPVVWPIDVVSRSLANLVANAIQASGPTDPVMVTAQRMDDAVRISVIDRGHGMTPGDLARAGEPFFTTKPAGGGTGLGLFVARSSTEQLGGTFGVTSERGRGTTATLTLPADVIHAIRR